MYLWVGGTSAPDHTRAWTGLRGFKPHDYDTTLNDNKNTIIYINTKSQ